jgi:hypothetical protein
VLATRIPDKEVLDFKDFNLTNNNDVAYKDIGERLGLREEINTSALVNAEVAAWSACRGLRGRSAAIWDS